MAKLPDGFVFTWESNRKGTQVLVTEHELVMCKHCKHCKERTLFGRTVSFCERGTAFDPRMYFSVEKDDWCSFGEREDDNG